MLNGLNEFGNSALVFFQILLSVNYLLIKQIQFKTLRYDIAERLILFIWGRRARGSASFNCQALHNLSTLNHLEFFIWWLSFFLQKLSFSLIFKRPSSSNFPPKKTEFPKWLLYSIEAWQMFINTKEHFMLTNYYYEKLE